MDATSEPASREWLDALRDDRPAPRRRGRAAARLLLRAARFEVGAAPGEPPAPARRGRSTTSPSRAPTTRSWRCSPSSTTFAATAGSPPGRTSSPCSRPPCGYAGWAGRSARCRSSRRPGSASPTVGSSPHASAETRELLGRPADGHRRGADAAPARGARGHHAQRASRSTCWPSGSAPPAARSTRRCTTRARSCAAAWPSRTWTSTSREPSE